MGRCRLLRFVGPIGVLLIDVRVVCRGLLERLDQPDDVSGGKHRCLLDHLSLSTRAREGTVPRFGVFLRL